MDIIKAEHVTYRYVDQWDTDETVEALKDINLNIREGAFVAVLGMNGSGKSTLAKNLNALILPDEGTVTVDGMDTADDEHLWEIRKTAGMVFQNPDNQIVSSIVEDDVAFGPENLGVAPELIRSQIDDAMKRTGIYELRHKAPSMLSGGQKQRVAIAGVLAMKPRCIIFDEPTAMLDPGGRTEIMQVIEDLHEQGITVVLITHFMEEAAKAEQVIVMHDGEVIAEGTPAEIFSQESLIESMGLKLPPAIEIRRCLTEAGLNVPRDIIDIDALAWWVASEARKRTSAKAASHGADAGDVPRNVEAENAPRDVDTGDAPQNVDTGDALRNVDTGDASPNADTRCVGATHPIVTIDHLTHVYNGGLPDEALALDDVSFTIDAGDFVGIIGHTGSGKSTLVQHINGLLKPSSGRIIVDGTDITAEGVKLTDIRKRVGLVFQYPEYQLFEESVESDVAFGAKNLGLSDEEVAERVREAIDLVGLDYETVKDRSPFELSGGQKRRAAIAGVLAMRPEILILDEPTAGLDPRAHDDILDMVENIRAKQGCTVILVSHNMDDVARLCTKVIVMDHGRLALQGTPGEVFSHDEKLVKIGLGLPAAAEFVYRLRKQGVDVADAATPADRAGTAGTDDATYTLAKGTGTCTLGSTIFTARDAAAVVARYLRQR